MFIINILNAVYKLMIIAIKRPNMFKFAFISNLQTNRAIQSNNILQKVVSQ